MRAVKAAELATTRGRGEKGPYMGPSSPHPPREEGLSERIQRGGETVDFVRRVVMDEADPDRLVFVAEPAVQAERVPGVVGPHPHLLLGQPRGHVGRGHAADV